eukprot:GHVS01050241.1.p1 GENE.GHVS01050241.1~~GHVS01050241.1.p1  ORF type:complete len:1419 (-),score=343.23 GHVS01050241.1:654-4910(-)
MSSSSSSSSSFSMHIIWIMCIPLYYTQWSSLLTMFTTFSPLLVSSVPSYTSSPFLSNFHNDMSRPARSSSPLIGRVGNRSPSKMESFSSPLSATPSLPLFSSPSSSSRSFSFPSVESQQQQQPSQPRLYRSPSSPSTPSSSSSATTASGSGTATGNIGSRANRSGSNGSSSPSISDMGDIVRDASQATVEQTAILDDLLRHSFISQPTTTPSSASSSSGSSRCRSFDKFYADNPRYFPSAGHRASVLFADEARQQTDVSSGGPGSMSYAATLRKRIEEAREEVKKAELAIANNNNNGIRGNVVPVDTNSIVMGQTGKPVYLDEPVCSSYIVDGNLEVCGDLRVRGRLSVVSGFNSTAIYADEPEHVKRRCHIRNGLFVDDDLNMPFSHLYVIGEVHVGGSVIAGEVLVDAGSHISIGLRGIKQALAVNDFMSDISVYSDMDGSLTQMSMYREVVIRRWYTGMGLFDQVGSTKSDIIRQRVGSNEQTLRGESEFGNNDGMSARRGNGRSGGGGLMVSAAEPVTVPGGGGEAVAMVLPVVLDVKCLMIDSMGVPVEHPNSGGDIREDENSGNGNKNRVRGEGGIGGGLGGWRHRQQQQGDGSSSSTMGHGGATGGAEGRTAGGAGKPGEDRTIGDLVSRQVSVHNGATVAVYGNVRAQYGLILDGGSEIHSLCGQVHTNSTGGIGVAAVDGSVGAFNGVGDNQVFQVTMQDSGILSFGGNLYVPAIVQVDESSVLSTVGSLLSSAIAVDDQSKVLVGGDLDISQLIEAIDYGSIVVGGNIVGTTLQVYDGGSIHCSGVISTSQFITLDGQAKVVVGGKATNSDLPRASEGGGADGGGDASSSSQTNGNDESRRKAVLSGDGAIKCGGALHVSGNSEVMVMSKNIEVNGTLKVVNSIIYIQQGSLKTQRNIVVGKKSKLTVGGNVETRGYMKTFEEEDIQTTAAGEAKQNRREEGRVEGGGGPPPGRFPRLLQSHLQQPEQIKRQEGQSWQQTNQQQQPQEFSHSSSSFDSTTPTSPSSPSSVSSSTNPSSSSSVPSPRDLPGQLDAQPALYVESSDVLVGGRIIAYHNWVEITQKSRVTITGKKWSSAAMGAAASVGGTHGSLTGGNSGSRGNGIIGSSNFGPGGRRGEEIASVQINGGVLVLDGGSVLSVVNGKVYVEKSVIMERNSILYIKNGDISIHDNMQLSDHSTASIRNNNVHVGGNMYMEGRSKMVIGKALLVEGDLLYVDEGSNVVAGAVGTTKGDIFVEDHSRLQTRTGDLISERSVICQDRSTISSAGNILARHGDVVAENNGRIVAVGSVIAASRSGSVRRTREASIVFGDTTGTRSVSVFVQDVPDIFLPSSLPALEVPDSMGGGSRAAVDLNPHRQSDFVSSRRWSPQQATGNQPLLSPEVMAAASTMNVPSDNYNNNNNHNSLVIR